jgi:hypothetical protein
LAQVRFGHEAAVGGTHERQRVGESLGHIHTSGP